MADNAGAMPGFAVDTARAHRGDAVDELGLAHRPHLDGAGGAHHRARLHEHGGDDVVAAIGIRQQFIEEIAPAGPVPQMVVGVDDRQIGREDRLFAPIEPVLANGKIVGCGGCRRDRHGGSPLAADVAYVAVSTYSCPDSEQALLTLYWDWLGRPLTEG